MNVKKLEGKLDAKGLKIGLVATRFNDFFTDKMLQGAVDCLIRHGAVEKDQTVVRVPGAFEVAPAPIRRDAGVFPQLFGAGEG